MSAPEVWSKQRTSVRWVINTSFLCVERERHRNNGKRAFGKDVENSGKDVFEQKKEEGSQHNKEEEWIGRG